jgi:non-specific serine/threonine protein kinase
VGDEWGTKLCLVNLGLFTLVVGDLERSAQHLRENLRLGRATDDKLPIQYGLFGLAHIASLEGRDDRAARLWGASEGIREAAGIELPPLASEMTFHANTVAAARERMGEAAFDAAWAEGKVAPLEDSLDYALET